jgi:thioredoxin
VKKYMLSLLLAASCMTAPVLAGEVVQLTDKNFNEVVLSNPLPVIIDVYADWCGPCKRLAPIFEELNKELGGSYQFTKLNVDHESALSDRFHVTGMPTLIFLKNGKEVSRLVGLPGKDELRAKIKSDLK